MVAIDYSFRDSEYYTKWYKQGIVPADNLFMGYQFVTGALGTITSIFSALKSDDTEGGGGTLNGTPIADDDGPTVTKKTDYLKKINTFNSTFKGYVSGRTPSENLIALAKGINEINESQLAGNELEALKLAQKNAKTVLEYDARDGGTVEPPNNSINDDAGGNIA